MLCSGIFATMQKNTQYLSETVRLKSESVDKARKVKKVTGIPICTFIEKAIDKEFDKLPKSIKEQIINI